MSDPLEILVLGWSGCPTTGTVREWIQQTCSEAGIPAPSVHIEYIETDAEAHRRGFVGSPTFVVDGVDLLPAVDSPPALSCRLYRLRDGRPSPLPDPADFVAALSRRAPA